MSLVHPHQQNCTIAGLRPPEWTPSPLSPCQTTLLSERRRVLSIRAWVGWEDVGEVLSLSLNVFVFSSLPVWSRGFGATEGKINTEQTSPGTRAIPRGILGMWLRITTSWKPPEEPHWQRKDGGKCSVRAWGWRGTHLRTVKTPTPSSVWEIPTLNPDLEFPALSEAALDDASLTCRQRDL